MTKERLLKTTFLMSILLMLIGAMLKILHIGGQYGYWIFIGAIIAHFIYVIVSIFEINNSSRIKSLEKIAWTIGFIFFSIVTAFLYYISGRARIIGLACG